MKYLVVSLISLFLFSGCFDKKEEKPTTPAVTTESVKKAVPSLDILAFRYAFIATDAQQKCELITEMQVKVFSNTNYKCNTLAEAGQPDVWSCTLKDKEYLIYKIYDDCQSAIKALNDSDYDG